MKLIHSLPILALTSSLFSADDAVQWPNGAGAAVCLTYDDSLASQLDIAYPQLQAAGLKGTFFLQGNRNTMADRIDDWRQVAASGHELGSHSLFHPCRKNKPGRDWVDDEGNLDSYSIAIESAANSK